MMKFPIFLLLIFFLHRHYRSGQKLRSPIGVASVAGTLLAIALLGFGL